MKNDTNTSKPRGEKLKSALRENLRKRKQQTRKLADNSESSSDSKPALKLRGREFSPKSSPDADCN